MALEIKITPTLRGEEAKNFLESIEKTGKKKIAKSKRKAMSKMVSAILDKAKI